MSEWLGLPLLDVDVDVSIMTSIDWKMWGYREECRFRRGRRGGGGERERERERERESEREREREREREESMQAERWYAEGSCMGIGDAHFLEVEDPSISLEAATCLLPVVGTIVMSNEL